MLLQRYKTNQRRTDNYEEYTVFKEDLEHYQQRGVPLYLEDTKASPDKIINTCCVREQGSYMGDYVMNEDGKLVMLRFDKIAKDKKVR